MTEFVYIVFSGSDRWFCGVFETEEKARERIDSMRRTDENLILEAKRMGRRAGNGRKREIYVERHAIQ